MEENKEIYYWICPKCKTEQKVISNYFVSDCISNEKCCKCGTRAYCVHPSAASKKTDKDVITYLKK